MTDENIEVTLGEVVLCVPGGERALESLSGASPIESLNNWLAFRSRPGTRPPCLVRLEGSTLCTAQAASTACFVLQTHGLPLLAFLEGVSSQPWRDPARLELHIKAEGDAVYRTLVGLREVVTARSRLAVGFDPW